MSNIKNLLARGLANAFGKSFTSSMFSFISGTSSTVPSRGTKGMLNAYNDLPWFRAILSKISKSTSTQQWKVFVQKRDGKPVRNAKIQNADFDTRSKMIAKGITEGTLEEIEGHPILDVLNGGNQFLPGSLNLQVSQVHVDSVGESFLLKSRNGSGVVEELFPLPAHWVVRVPQPGGERSYDLSIGSLQQTIPEEDMIWIKEPNPLDPYSRGSGVARSIIDELETDEFAAKHTKAWFYNSAKPDIIVAAEGLQKGDTKRLEEDWLSKNQGFLKRFKPYFMNAAVKIHELNSSFKEMELIKLREFERDLFIQVFGIPPEIMGIIENSNRATIDSADMIFAKYVLIPRLEVQRTIFQADLVPEYDSRLILGYDSPLKEDKDFTLEVMKSQPVAFTIDEWRELAGQPELDDGKGKVFPVPFNIILSEDLDAGSVPLPTPPAEEPPEKSKKITKVLSPENNELLGDLLVSLRAQIMVDAMIPTITETVDNFGKRMVDNVGGLRFDISDPVVTDFISTQSTSRIRGMIDGTTRKQLRKSLIDGFDAGESIKDITARVNRVFDNATSNRSAAIARTETVRAANFGSLSGMKQTGVPRKQWLSSRDIIVRESHAIGSGMDLQTVKVDANFKSPISGAEGPHPGDLRLASEDVNCRCTVVPVFEDDDIRSVKEVSEEARLKIWKGFEQERKPFEKRMRLEVNKGFEIQRDSVLAVLND